MLLSTWVELSRLRKENRVLKEEREILKKRRQFPKPCGGGIVVVSYPFVLTPTGKGTDIEERVGESKEGRRR